MISSNKIAQSLIDIHLNNIRNKNLSIEEISTKFLSFIKKYNLEAQLPSILKSLEIQVKKYEHFNTLDIKSSHALNSDTVEKIKEFVKKITKSKDSTEIKTKFQIDKSLIGGFQAFFRDKKIDASIDGNLKRLERELVK
jgi:F0F1-type ATP synthase delta subunit